MQPSEAFKIQQDEMRSIDDIVEKSDRQFILCFQISTSKFGMEFEKVSEIVDYFPPTEYPFKVDKHIGIINLRGNVVPIVDPFQVEIDRNNKENFKFVVIETECGNLVGIIVSNVRKIDVDLVDIDNVDGEKVISVNGEPLRFVKTNTFFKDYREVDNGID